MEEITLFQVVEFFKSHTTEFVTIDALIVAFLVERSKKIKFTPISWLGSKIGNWLTGELMDKVLKMNTEMEGRLRDDIDVSREESKDRAAKLHEEIENLKKTFEDRIDCERADHDRMKILEFDEGLLRGVTYSEEHLNMVMVLVDRYEAHCRSHDKYVNSLCEEAIEHIREHRADMRERRHAYSLRD